MTTPKSVTEHPELDWINVDDKAWITGNIRDEAESLSQVYVAHIDPMYDVECPRSPHSIRDATVFRTLINGTHIPSLNVAGLRCPLVENRKWCSWKGSIEEGHWVDA